MAKFQLYLEQPKGVDPTRLLLYIHWSGRRLKYPTGCNVLPLHWQTDRQQVTGQVPTCRKCSHPQVDPLNAAGERVAVEAHREINTRVEFLRAAAVTALDRFARELKRPPEKEELRMAIMWADNKATGSAPEDLFGFAQAFIESQDGQFNSKRKAPLHKATLSRYKVTLALLREYVAQQHNGNPNRLVHFSSVDQEFVIGFTAFLTKNKGFAANTVVRYGRTLRLFLRKAKAKKHLAKEVDDSVFTSGLTLKEEPTDQVYLNERELADFYALNLSHIPHMERARDLFIVGAWTGLRFGDLCRIQPEHFEGDRLRVQPSKTGKEVLIPLHPTVRAVVMKYGGRVPSGVSNQKQNDALKRIGPLVPSLQAKVMIGRTIGGIRREVARAKWEMVTTHTARRSFASNLYLSGVPARSIMKVTGHTTEQSFMRYIRLTDDEHMDLIAASPMFAAPLMQVAG